MIHLSSRLQLVMNAALLALAAGCASPLPPKGAVSAWRIGPLVERARLETGERLLAVRPFYSHEETADEPFRSVTDILWPVGSFRQRDERRSWRFFPAYGTGNDAPAADGAHRFRLLPIFFEGRTRAGEDYWALFPLYGQIRDFLGLGHVRFVLFPLYATADSRETHTRTILWPFYLTRHGPDIEQFRLWPFYGKREVEGRKAHTRHFVLWPFWSDIRMENEAIQGHGFVLFPLYGRSRFTRGRKGEETGWTVLPPFFSHVRGEDGYRALRAPWPFIRQTDDGDERQRHWWPFYGTTTNALRRDWYALWPIVSSTRAELPREQIRQFAIHPFYYQETRLERPRPDAGDAPVTDRYRRVWPLFSWQRGAAGSQVRVPELTLFRRSAAIERNWAPLWSLFVRRERADGARVTDLLWGLAAWGHDADGRRFLQLLWALRFRGDPAAETEGEAQP